MLQNKAPFDRKDLEEIFGKDALFNFPEEFSAVGICTDSRKLEPGNIFLAIKGERFDAHNKIRDVLESGGAAAVAEIDWLENQSEINGPVIGVNSSIEAVGALAAKHRSRFEIPIVAIAGSNGKTTTKEMIADCLAKKYTVLRSFENFNNQLGVPIMLLQLNEEIEIAALEIGTNEPGEIRILSEIVNPTHGIITNIGKEHLEKLIDLDGVEMEETALFAYLKKTGGTAFLNIDDERLRKYIPILDKKILYGTLEEAQVKAKIELDDFRRSKIFVEYGEAKFTASLKAYGAHNGKNAVAAAAAALEFDVAPEDVRNALENFAPAGGKGYGRFLVENIEGVTIINDCYNSNPESAREALALLKDMPLNGKRYAILGDMLELGAASEAEHYSLIDEASKVADLTYLFGKETKKSLLRRKSSKDIFHFDDKNNLTNKLLGRLSSGDAVLVKGSRGMRLENVINNIKERMNKKR